NALWLEVLRDRRITAVIPEPNDQTANRRRRGRAGGHPPRFDPAAYLPSPQPGRDEQAAVLLNVRLVMDVASFPVGWVVSGSSVAGPVVRVPPCAAVWHRSGDASRAGAQSR